MSLWTWLALVAITALLTYGGFAAWCTWHYLSWIRKRRQWFVENRNRKRTSR